MYEKVNPEHPDKLADRIGGALVDMAYRKKDNPKVALEVLLGHRRCYIVGETDVSFGRTEVKDMVTHIAGNFDVVMRIEKQNANLADIQKNGFRCADNGIFKGVPVTDEQRRLADIACEIYDAYHSDGKYILDGDRLIICQSNAGDELKDKYPNAIVNPAGYWTGGTDVDSGAINRKLGSDMGDSITGGGMFGKDLSKADVSLYIYTWLKAQRLHQEVNISCAIGDGYVDGLPYGEIVEIARDYVDKLGGFEKLAEWGLIR